MSRAEVDFTPALNFGANAEEENAAADAKREVTQINFILNQI
jgi:hypothetical protein